MRAKKRRAEREVVTLVALAFVLGFCLGAVVFSVLPLLIERIWPATEREVFDPEAWFENYPGAAIGVVAITSAPEPVGVVCTLAVRIEPGGGHVWHSSDPLLMGFDFQDADRKAVEVAGELTGRRLDEDGVGISGLDIYFIVWGPGEEMVVDAVDGASAGSAATIAVVAALEGREIKEGYLITGTIEENGVIGPVGGVFYKAQAAEESGASYLLVPEGQSTITMYEEEVRRVGRFRWVVRRPVVRDLNEYAEGEGWGLEIIEVSNIREAMDLMLE